MPIWEPDHNAKVQTLIVVSGPVGVGKSFVIRRIASLLRAHGFEVQVKPTQDTTLRSDTPLTPNQKQVTIVETSLGDPPPELVALVNNPNLS